MIDKTFRLDNAMMRLCIVRRSATVSFDMDMPHVRHVYFIAHYQDLHIYFMALYQDLRLLQC